MRMKLPKSIYNNISAIGAILIVGSIIELILQFFILIFSNQSGYFLGVFLFVFAPINLFLGVILILTGIKKKERTNKLKMQDGELDDEYISQRNALVVFIVGLGIFFIVIMIGNIKTMNFANSDAFCGEVCHSAMEPEFITYKNSKHDDVSCIHCHYNEDDDLLLKSKLAALRQITTILGGNYNLPLSTPSHTLRPIRSTCVHCHRPILFDPETIRLKEHYLVDEENSRWNINLVLKIGNEQTSEIFIKGIHWHVHPDNLVQYVSNNNKQEIPWIRYINKTRNDTTLYIDNSSGFNLSYLDTLEIWEMDCMDCHNRTSHNFMAPSQFINQQLSLGNIYSSIPEIKSNLLEICEEIFPSIDSLKTFSSLYIKEFYKENYIEYYESNEKIIISSIDAFVDEYAKNIFPAMNVSWQSYSSNIGHLYYKGCFRCHNDLHKSEEGKILKRDCNLCHTITAQGNPNNLEQALPGEALDFKHPVDIDEEWRETNCNECHTGLTPNVYKKKVRY